MIARIVATTYLLVSSFFACLVSASELIQQIPAGANALLLIDVSALESTPMGRSQGWARKLEAASVERPVILPPEATQIVIGSQLNFVERMSVQWQVAAMTLKEPILMRAIARAEGGYFDKIGGVDCVWGPSDAYFVLLDLKQLGVVYPANRQLVSRWTQKTLGTVSSGYLSAAAKHLGRSTQIVMAVDLVDVPQPHRVRENVQASVVLKTLSTKLETIEQLILGVKGVALEIAVGQSAKGTLTVDFNDSPAVLATQVKPLLLEAFDNFGIQLPGLDQWTAKVESKSIVLEGTLSTDALRRVFSLLELPSANFSTENDEHPDSPSATTTKTVDKKAAASLVYFKQVSVLIDDLRKTLDNTKDNHAVIMERYGRKVDAFPVLNVDDNLLVWGGRVGETFREMALARRGSNLQGGVRKSSFYNNYYSTQTFTNIQGQIDTEANAQAKAVRYNNWKAMEDATATIRKEMTKRYQVEF